MLIATGRERSLSDRAHLAAERASEQLGRFEASRLRVEVRIGAIRDERVARVEHRLAQVGVSIRHDDDRDIRPDSRTDASEPLAVRVVLSLADGGAMGRREDPVERSQPAQRLEHLADEVIERGLGDAPARGRDRHEDGDRGEPLALEPLEKAGDLVVRASPSRTHVLADTDVESTALGERRQERVRLVVKADDPDAHVSSPPLSRIIRSAVQYGDSD